MRVWDSSVAAKASPRLRSPSSSRWPMSFRDDVRAVFERDPAATNLVEVLLTYPGLHAILLHRLAHRLHQRGIPVIPRVISPLGRWLTGIEIHPGATIGRGLFIDHGMGLVIGETSEIGDGVTLHQGVTLGGTGKERGKRHPTLGNNVYVGVGAKILGAVKIGDGAKVGGGAVVVRDVPPYTTPPPPPAHPTRAPPRQAATSPHPRLPPPAD